MELRVEIPTFDGRLGKNARLQRGRYGDKAIQRLKDSFTLVIRSNAQRLVRCDNLEVELIVYRPDKSWDAHNFLDAFCDIVQSALYVNDRYFKSVKATPEYDPINPRFELILKGDPVERRIDG